MRRSLENRARRLEEGLKHAQALARQAPPDLPDPEELEEMAQQFEIPLKRSDIADFLGLTIETVSRQITKLRQSGVIKIANNRTVEIPDLEKLHALTEIHSTD